MRRHTVPEKSRARPWAQILSIPSLTTLCGVVAPVLFLGMVVSVDILQPGQGLIQQTVSMLVFGAYGWLQTAAFYLFGLLLLAFAIRFSSGIARKPTLHVGGMLIAGMGVEFLLLGLFPARGPGAMETLQTLIHRYTAVEIVLLFSAACFLIGASFRVNPGWKGFFAHSVGAGVLSLLLGALWGMVTETSPWSGLIELVLLVNGLIWLEALAVRLFMERVQA